ncbi:hypothetical protein B14911_17485 [Bacillus sp. NRRL B-14911]|uniref:Uncharacterized protein n=1 Tax=Bacillus infantis NRRL B-14911 TaxID=1367477 RepID=U5L7M8_9BACI|nr:hypothetical protein N288_03495 [Bacillus infantis NRRL B-14911]EAR64357.1 hypothetical protein B14911_17485 [Bacillus sp. NRRL B-14911]
MVLIKLISHIRGDMVFIFFGLIFIYRGASLVCAVPYEEAFFYVWKKR